MPGDVSHPLEPETRKLTRLYILALTTVALLSIAGQILVQWSLRQQTTDSQIVNIAGRQRMLSQRLVKSALAMNLNMQTSSTYLEEFAEVLQLWEESQTGLLNRDKDQGLAGDNSPTVLAMYAEIEHAYNAMRGAAHTIIAIDTNETSRLREQIAILLQQEPAFLEGMDNVVFQYAKEARDRVQSLQQVELALLLTTLVVLLIEGLLIFRPVTAKISNAILALKRAEEREAHIARELQTILDLTPALICYLDAQGNVLRMNKTASDIFAQIPHKSGTLNGFTLLGIPPADSPDTLDGLRMVQLVQSDKSTQSHYFRIQSVPYLDDKDLPVGTIILAEDVTDQEALERRVMNIRADEQRRLGQDLHDDLGQLLTGILYLSRSLSNRTKSDHPAISNDLDEITSITKDSIQRVRDMVAGLCPLDRSGGDFVRALRDLAATTERVTKIETVLIDDVDEEVTFPDETGEHLFRITQEAVNNAVRHSRATRIEIGLRQCKDSIEISVSDNGEGFTAVHEDSVGHGLSIMRRRAELCGAEFSMKVTGGTTIRCRIAVLCEVT